MIEIRQTETFARWLAALRDAGARMRINVRIRRLSIGNPGDVKPVGEGVSEMRIDYGPGYRVYFVQRGAALVILLAGGNSSSYWRAGISTRKSVTSRQHARLRGSFRRIAMGKTKTIAWDAVDHLKTDEDIAHYLEAVLEDGDPALVTAALGDIARAKGMSQVARDAGLGRESLYKALSPDGNPEFATVLKVIRALGLKLKVAV
jgi:probable addiction module antidote protein/putative addiction module killer protein